MSEEAAASAIADNDNPFAGLGEDKEDKIKTLGTDLNFLRTNYSDQDDADIAIH